MSDLQFKQAFAATQHGPSPYGISRYSEAFRCARMANIKIANKALGELEDMLTEDEPVQVGKPAATDVGTAFHALMEAYLNCALGEDIIYDNRASAYNPAQLEALRLFTGWRKRWDSPKAKYGMDVSLVEAPLGYTVDTSGAIVLDQEVIGRLGGPLTGRLDFGGDIGMDGAALTFANTGALLPDVGLYGGDWKTAGQNSKHAKRTFELSLQGKAYLWLYNLKHPDAPMKGMLFDKVVRHKALTDESFSTFLVTSAASDEQLLATYVKAGQQLLGLNHANPDQCIDWRTGRECPFLGKQCDRF